MYLLERKNLRRISSKLNRFFFDIERRIYGDRGWEKGSRETRISSTDDLAVIRKSDWWHTLETNFAILDFSENFVAVEINDILDGYSKRDRLIISMFERLVKEYSSVIYEHSIPESLL